ncbi:MAG TPA: c-type cytochrome [Hyphomicrobiales bacterium]|nr:c-type cytochrome [Hyphomicrobiales bacterium]
MKLKTTLALAALVSVYASGAMAAGDAEKGKALYATCGACHGPNAEGMEALNAPRLAGQEEWYVIRQLENFKNGIRGANAKDTYGMQMAPMAQVLPTPESMADVAAYIKSLGN